jgi:DNA-binding GntR family transcriptional regulator
LETKPRHGNIQDAIYANLRKNIVNLRLEPGKVISEKEIARRYRVSRTPVREAFIRLAKEGLVRVIPQKETSVSLIDWSRVIQEFFLRESLETAVLVSLADHSGTDQFALAEHIIETQNTVAFTSGDYVEFVNHDDLFHHAFFEAAGQALSWDVLQNMSGH